MPTSQSDKAVTFRALHQGPRAFVIANAWDGGSARALAALGFPALATSSGAQAGVLGRRDGSVSRDEALAHCHTIVAATDLPVSADLEKGFSNAPEAVAETIRLAAAAGLVGGSIEDATGEKTTPLYDLGHATERVAAAVQAARALPFPFTLTARAEGFLRGNTNLDDAIRRLQAYENAGADVLMAPGLPDLATVRAVCAAVSKPFNFMAGIKGKSFTVAELEAAGARRISLATSLYRAAMSGMLDAAREARDKGTFGYPDRAIATPEWNAFMKAWAGEQRATVRRRHNHRVRPLHRGAVGGTGTGRRRRLRRQDRAAGGRAEPPHRAARRWREPALFDSQSRQARVAARPAPSRRAGNPRCAARAGRRRAHQHAPGAGRRARRRVRAARRASPPRDRRQRHRVRGARPRRRPRGDGPRGPGAQRLDGDGWACEGW